MTEPSAGRPYRGAWEAPTLLKVRHGGMVGVCIGLTTLSAGEAGITPCHGGRLRC